MKSNSFENLIQDQIFKLKPSDKTLVDFMNDCVEEKKDIKKSHGENMAHL